jgi:diguanylate cyclase (GGDEF)-like protein/PAS domain S-box-containing protein
MVSPVTVLSLFSAYMGALFLVALWVERSGLRGQRDLASHPVVYALSLAVYCTSWTYYGSIGYAVNKGLLFLAIYLGPTLGISLWWTILRKLVRIKSQHRITSIADFISARYGRSQGLAALATAVALLGSMPYVALQLKSVLSTFAVITSPQATVLGGFITRHVGPVVVFLMIAFTIVFGARRIDPTERHRGMVTAVALESVVKLLAFLCAGIFVTYGLFGGFGDILQQAAESAFRRHITFAGQGGTTYLSWMSLLALSMSAILFLPRQFHVAVVESSNEKHILTAMWLLPLYMILINVFVVPVAMGGLLRGLPVSQADTFLLRLPMESGHRLLALLVFLGGFSAATSMIMISSMTHATMITNHLLLPAIHHFEALRRLRRRALECRWAAVCMVLLIGYWFERTVAAQDLLVNIGILAFAAAIQFAPPILAGIFWRRANKIGAFLGLSAGLVTWLYTMLLPSLIKSGLLPPEILSDGPWSIELLRPESLLGLTGFDPTSHTLFWSMLLNFGGLTFGSMFFEQNDAERRLADSFVDVLSPVGRIPAAPADKTSIERSLKKEKIVAVFSQFFSEPDAEAAFARCAAAAGIGPVDRISITELARLVSEVEKSLSGSFGSATANAILMQADLYTAEEREALAGVYTEILTRMNVAPEELRRKIDYYQEKDQLLTQHGRELEEKIAQRDQEIAERERIERALREAEEKYRGIFENAEEGIFQSVAAGRFVSANPAMAKIFGYDSPASLIEEIHDIGREIYADPAERQKMIALVEASGKVTGFETQALRKDRSVIWISINARAVRAQSGELLYVEGIVQDITAQKRMLEQLTHNAFYDNLTGLPNRAMFMDRLKLALQREARRRDYRFAVLFLDLDRFKYINDSFGHLIGDQLLISMAGRLKTSTRSMDMVARFGGDEFAVLVEEIEDFGQATLVAGRIRQALTAPFEVSGLELHTSASIGIVLSTSKYGSAEDVLRDADIALYGAKATGRAQFRVFDQEMHQETVRQFELETNLRRALERGEFLLHFQPIVSLSTMKIVGMEALCRWSHPKHGLILPAAFISVAEETGLIAPLGLWVMKEACRQAREIQQQYPHHSSFTVSVNLSGRQLAQSELFYQIRDVIQETGLDPRHLKLEITESVLMENAETTNTILTRLKSLGIQLAIDDFGTGYSSLSYLQLFPIDTLKIDRTFINQMTIRRENEEIVRTIVQLAHNLGMDVVAEGVEVESQLAQLVASHCEFAQGYLFSGAVDSTRIVSMLSSPGGEGA